jgi:hypothetical protein
LQHPQPLRPCPRELSATRTTHTMAMATRMHGMRSTAAVRSSRVSRVLPAAAAASRGAALRLCTS